MKYFKNGRDRVGVFLCVFCFGGLFVCLGFRF